MAEALCTLQQVKDYLKLSGAGQDEFLQNLVDAASDAIERHCGRQFRERTYTDERHDGDGRSKVLQVRHYPIVSVGSLYDDVSRDFASSTLVDSDDYEVYADEGLIVRVDCAFSKGTRNVKVTYNAGYAEVPEGLMLACVMLAAEYYFQSPTGKGRHGIKTDRLPGGQGDVTYERVAIPEQALALIGPYRRMSVG